MTKPIAVDVFCNSDQLTSWLFAGIFSCRCTPDPIILITTYLHTKIFIYDIYTIQNLHCLTSIMKKVGEMFKPATTSFFYYFTFLSTTPQ